MRHTGRSGAGRHWRRIAVLALASAAVVAAVGRDPAAEPSGALRPSGPLVIRGEHGTVYSRLRISAPSSDCVQIIDSTDVTISESDIGPCGSDGTTAPGRGIQVSGGSGIRIYDNYIHVERRASACCDSHVGILTMDTSRIVIQGNVIAFGETNIEAQTGTDDLRVIGNFLLNPRGPFPRGQQFQASRARNMTVENNYALATDGAPGFPFQAVQEDAINFWRTRQFTAKGNYIVGGRSPSGCGLLADDQSDYGTFIDNVLSNTGQCGIGIASGVGHLVDRNRVLNLTPIAGAGNTAIYVWKQYAADCGGNGERQIVVSNNVAHQIKPDGRHSGWWNGGGCDPVKLIGNVFDEAAHRQLAELAKTQRPPPIPPQPFRCVAASPYSTQTSHPACSSAPMAPAARR